MATQPLSTNSSADDFIEAAEQLSLTELEKITRQLLHIQARRKAPHLSQREAELIEEIAQISTSDHQERYLFLNKESGRRALTPDEQTEFHQLIAHSEALTAHRLALLIELSQLRGVSLDTVMKQLQIKAPGIV